MTLFVYLSITVSKKAFSSEILKIPVREIYNKYDPYQGNSFTLNKITKQVYPSLLKFNSINQPTPRFLQSWKIDDKNNAIIFYLKKGQLLSNKRKLNSKIVLNSLRRSKNKGNLFYQNIQGCLLYTSPSPRD